jgi:transcriptional regulator with XRE-family HTH domain
MAQLRRIRQARGLSQRELARRVHLTRTDISQFERGYRRPTWESVLKICEVLGVPPDVVDEFRTPEAAERRLAGPLPSGSRRLVQRTRVSDRGAPEPAPSGEADEESTHRLRPDSPLTALNGAATQPVPPDLKG